MVITVVLLGKLADIGGAPSLTLGAPRDWAELTAAWPTALAAAIGDPRNHVALNGALLADKTALRAVAGDEVAFLPPVSGG